MNFSSLPPAVAQIKAGNLRALAVTGEKRIKSLPDVPTLKEQGIERRGERLAWAVRAGQDARRHPRQDRGGTPKQAMKEAQVGEEALAKGRGWRLPPDRTRAQFAKFVADEHAFWGKKLKALKIDME